jgi:hypothetical protein
MYTTGSLLASVDEHVYNNSLLMAETYSSHIKIVFNILEFSKVT